MPSYTLEIEAFGTFTTNAPSLEVWADGVLNSTHSVSATGTTISVTIAYGGSLPTSLAFTFNDGFAPNGRIIEVRAVKINDKYVNTNNFLSSDSLTHSQTATVDITNSDFIFDSSEPLPTEFTTGATRTFTTGNDTMRDFNGSTDEVFDLLAGRDIVYLGSGNDKVNGNAGDDIIRGGAGNDLLFGDTGNDRLLGQDGNDTIYGGDGDDRIHGHDGNDELHGGNGNDRLNGHNDDDIITGGAGDDKLTGGAGDDYLYGGDDNDSLMGGTGADTLDGGAGNDILYGGAGVDHINGGDDDDIIVGDDGDDVLHGDDGDDVLYGRGDDDEIYGGNNNDLLLGGDGNDTLDGGAGVDVLTGGAGVDTLQGGGGNDTLHGHGLTQQQIQAILNANPTVSYNPYTNSFYEYVNSNISISAARSAAESSTLGGINGHIVSITSAAEETYVDGLSTQNIWISGNDEDNEGVWVWRGGAEDGANFYNGAVGGTTVSSFYTNWGGGEPNDFNTGEDYAQARNGSTWNDYGPPFGSQTLRYVVEWDAGLMSDDNAADILNGGDGNDHLYGYGGDDVLSGDNNDDLLFGGEGNDTLNGGSNDDALFGQNGDDILNGGAGADFIYGGAGADTIILDAGNDVIDGGAGIDVIDASSHTGYVTVDLSILTAQSTRLGTDTISGVENLIGSDFNDTLGGDAGVNTINGGLGGDRIYGNGGADFLYGEAGNDDFYVSGTIAYDDLFDGGADFDEIQFTADSYFNLAASFVDMERIDMNGFDTYALLNDGLDFSGMTVTARGDIYGDTGSETITGSDSADYIYGLAGADILNGGLGNDYVYGGDDGDLINGNDGNDRLYGEAGVDTINGGAGTDYIYGGAGADILNGGDSGDNFYISGTDSLGDQYDGGAGGDSIRLEADSYFNSSNSITSVTYIFMNGFNLISALGDGFDLTGTLRSGTGNLLGQGGNETITGGDNADYIYGLAGADILNGGLGNDYLYGGDDSDTINGGDGNDSIYGEAGSDVLNGNAGADNFYIGGTEAIGDTIDGGADSDDIYLTSNLFLDFTTSFTSIERVVFGGFTITANTGTGFNLTGMTRSGTSNLYGQGGVETIGGTEGDDNIYGLAGADILTGNGGNDNFYVSGTDSIGDQYDGGAGGDDEIILQADSYFSSANSFTNMEQMVFGGFDAYVTLGSTIDFSSLARSGTGTIIADTGNETITGMTNNDTIYGLDGDDVIDGFTGSDIIYGGAGADTLNGGDGNDNFYISGTDALGDIYDGGTGTDYIRMDAAVTFNSANSFANITAIVNGGFDMNLVSGTTIDFSGMNRSGGGAIVGTAGNETITGFDNTNVFYGLGGTDVMIGGSGNDDFYVSGTEALGDTFDGGSGGTDDEIRLLADTEFDSSITMTSIEQIVFGGFNITLSSGTTVDFSGMTRSGTGQIHGNTGGETIYGMENADFIYAGAGDDVIYGGDGRDELYGEGGADTFVLENLTAFNDIERIWDFSTAENDALDITDLLSGYTYGVDTLTDFVQIVDSGANSTVYVDVTGSGTFTTAERVATLYGINGLTDEAALETSGHLVTY